MGKPTYVIPTYKHQISNKFEISMAEKGSLKSEMFGILNFGHWYLFGICDLLFVIILSFCMLNDLRPILVNK